MVSNVSRRVVWLGCALAALLVLLAVFSVEGTHAGFTAGVKNPTNLVGAGTAFATVKNSTGNTLCSSVPSGSSVPTTSLFNCAGSPIPATVSSSAATYTDLSLVHSGTQSFGAAQVSATTCYPRVYGNSFDGANPMLPRYGATADQAGPSQLSGSASILFDGTSGQATSNGAFTNPQTFSIGAWFRTTAKRGTIVGFSSTANASSFSNYDRLLFVDNAGNVVWDTVPGGGAGNVNDIASSGTNYADGAWHFAVGVGQAGASASTINLYVDGALVNSKSIAQSISAESYNGYWRLGYTPQDSRANSGGVYFAGNISNVSYVPAALTSAQVSTLWQSGSQAAYGANLSGLGATAWWPLGSEQTYTGALAGGNNPCAAVTLYAQGAAVGALNNNPSGNIDPLTVGATQSVRIGVATNGNYNTFAAGLHLDLYVNVIEQQFSQTFRWPHIVTVLR